MVISSFSEELGTRGASTLLGLMVGAVVGWCYGRWKRHRERISILLGDARDTVVIQQHIVESLPDPATPSGRRPISLRIRSVGQSQVNRVVPNGHLASVLLARAGKASATHTLISMEGPEGSFLLETLTGFVGDRLGCAPFEHDLYVMTPCCEPHELSTHQLVSIILISVADLALFEHWPSCRGVLVEHGSDGSRLLTLMALARKFRAEQDEITRLRREGQRTKHIETMYVLDLPLDKRSADVPLKPVPWERFESILKQMGLC